MEIQVTTRDGKRHIVDPSDIDITITSIRDAADDELVRVLSEISDRKATFVRRGDITRVEVIDPDDTGGDDPTIY